MLIIGTKEAFRSINRLTILTFLFSCKNKNGSFNVHISGECDIRSSYCAFSIAFMINLLTPELIQHAPRWIVSCQNFEGGIGGSPGDEAHGGQILILT